MWKFETQIKHSVDAIKMWWMGEETANVVIVCHWLDTSFTMCIELSGELKSVLWVGSLCLLTLWTLWSKSDDNERQWIVEKFRGNCLVIEIKWLDGWIHLAMSLIMQSSVLKKAELTGNEAKEKTCLQPGPVWKFYPGSEVGCQVYYHWNTQLPSNKMKWILLCGPAVICCVRLTTVQRKKP